MFKKIIYGLCLLRNKLISRDDFTWKRYHKNYYDQIKRNEKDYTLKLTDDFEIVNGKLKFNCNPPLNKNHELLYQIIHDLNPVSIFEVGCGNGDHMYNILKIMPYVDIGGCDLLSNQLKFLNERNPGLKDKTFVLDITKNPVFSHELIYTQAVLMHIQKDNRHLDALRNLFRSSGKYIVLIENWSRHNFYDDIINISNELSFPWNNLYIYKVDNGKQIAMVLSKVPIANYVELKSNDEMLKYLK
jgi:trans-aconitate methyltransferase